ncbi:MAG: hypothetical protein KatS3mg091_394 [Patescibacteria group bacterium]|nr:MAG: hypothetical protein KatS3mg091_394 [Patescibacteria group bacterium]
MTKDQISKKSSIFSIFTSSFKKVFAKKTYYLLTISIALNIIFIYYLIFLQTTTWELFWQSNIDIYNWLQIILSIINSILIGIAISMFAFILDNKNQTTSFLEILGSLIYSSAATGCTVCGAILLPTLGIAASLSALPLGGLEIKILSILLLIYAIYEYSKNILGLCVVKKERLISITNNNLELNIKKETLSDLKPLAVILIFLLTIYLLPKLPNNLKINFSKKSATNALNSNENKQQATDDEVLSEINPQQGYEINAEFGNLGPKMIELGVIDLEKFKNVYERSGQPLTQEQIDILTKGSNQKVKIDRNSAYFLLNFFWAAGLANKSKVLTEGEITKYGQDQLGYFASTGGWSLSKTEPMNYYAKERLIPLTPDQEILVEKVASNIYRPCCNNSTAFPDCNHGMALLAVLQLMAANGATENQMYEAAKYFNAFWFPQNYYDLALYFKNKEGKTFRQINNKTLLSAEFSSASGWQRAKKWLQDNGIVQQPPQTGGSCGV